MVYQANQIHDAFSGALGRPATDFEVKKFSTASPQTLATLKDSYGKLNTSSSISDYLTSVGQDNSLQARQALGQKYGIANIGTAEGNTALLTTLKSGKPPTTTPVQGSISPVQQPQQSDQSPVDQTAQNGQGTVQLADVSKQQPDQTMTGTVQTAAQTSGTPTGTQTETKTPTTPDVSTDQTVTAAHASVNEALTNYQSYQKQVADIDTKIANLRQTISGALQDKEAQAAASGGVVSRTQIATEVGAQTKDIQRQINELLAQRAPLATAQSQYSQSLQQARNDLKDAQANFYKSQTLGQGQQKIENQAQQFNTKTGIQQDQFATKTDIQQAQFTQKEADVAAKLALSGMKVEKLNSRDEFGNVNGQYIKVINLNGTTTEGVPAISPTGTYTSQSGQTLNSNSSPSTTFQTTPTYAKQFTTNADAPNKENQSVKVPGLGITMGTLYQDALDWMAKPQATGKKLNPVAAAIAAKGASILNALGVDKLSFEASYKANGTALTKLMSTYGLLLSNEGAADRNFKTLIALGQKVDKNVYTSTVPFINDWVRSGQIKASGNSDVNNYVAQLSLALNEYAKVISGQTGGGAVSDSARLEVASLLSKGQNIQTVQDFYNNVVIPDLINRKAGSQDAIKELTSGVSSGLNAGETKPQEKLNDVSAGSTITYQGKTYNVDANGNLTPQ